MRVQLASHVAGGNVDLGQVSIAENHYVGGRFDKVCRGDRPGGDQTRTSSTLKTPGNFDSLRIGNEAVGLWWCEKTEVGCVAQKKKKVSD